MDGYITVLKVESEYRPPNVARWASICLLMGPHMLPGGPPYASQHKCPHLGRPIINAQCIIAMRSDCNVLLKVRASQDYALCIVQYALQKVRASQNYELSEHHFLSTDDVHTVLCGLTAEAEAGERVVDLMLWLAVYITDTR